MDNIEDTNISKKEKLDHLLKAGLINEIEYDELLTEASLKKEGVSCTQDSTKSKSFGTKKSHSPKWIVGGVIVGFMGTLLFFAIGGGISVKTSNTVGKWIFIDNQFEKYDSDPKHYTIMEIIRLGKGSYTYEITGVMDYAATEKRDKYWTYSGKFKSLIWGNKWRLKDPKGSEKWDVPYLFGGRSEAKNAFIIVPDDKWDDYEPKSLTVGFDKLDEELQFEQYNMVIQDYLKR